MSIATTPVTISEEIRNFCAGISEVEPIYVPVQPLPAMKWRACFPNVDSVVQIHGGKRVNGWVIWENPGRLIEAEAHAVWVGDGMPPLDVTPKEDGETRILFLPDPNVLWPGPYFPNRRLYLVDDELTRAEQEWSETRDRIRTENWNGRNVELPADVISRYPDLF